MLEINLNEENTIYKCESQRCFHDMPNKRCGLCDQHFEAKPPWHWGLNYCYVCYECAATNDKFIMARLLNKGPVTLVHGSS